MRVLHLAKYYHPFRGGIETHVRSLAVEQVNRGMDVTVLCINHMDRQGKDVWNSRVATTPTIETHDEGVRIIRVGKIGTLARFDFCPTLHSVLKNRIRQSDIVHLHVPNPTMCVALASMKRTVPWVVMYHSDIVKQRFIRKPFRLIERHIFKKVDRFIASSENYLGSSEVLTEYRAKTSVIPFGIDLNPYLNPSQKALEYADSIRARSNGEPVWLCVGRLVYYKGCEVAVRAIAKCLGRLLIVGTGPMEAALKTVAMENNVMDRIEWIPYLSDDELIGAYHAATAFWFPSLVRSEAFGLVQIEAMASGCPVINSDIEGSGVPWVSLHNVSGLTVPSNDSNALAECATKLADSPQRQKQLSNQAVARAREEFSCDIMYERTKSLYDDVLSECCPSAHSE